MKKILNFVLIFILVLSSNVYASQTYNNVTHDNNKCSRIEYLKKIINMLNYKLNDDISDTSMFKDVLKTDENSIYIMTAKENGIISGYPDGTFKPNDNISLFDAVTISMRLLGEPEQKTNIFYNYMDGAKINKLIDEDENNYQEIITNEQADKLIFRTMINSSDAKIFTSNTDSVFIFNTKILSIFKNVIYTDKGCYNLSKTEIKLHENSTYNLKLDNNCNIIEAYPLSDITKNYETKIIYSLYENNIFTLDNEKVNQIQVFGNENIYYNGNHISADDLKDNINPGDILNIHYNNRNEIDYMWINVSKLYGPEVYDINLKTQMLNNKQLRCVKNDKVVNIMDIELNDVLYYSNTLNTIYAYNNFISGVLEKVIPNFTQPKSLIVSGNEYKIGDVRAFKKISYQGYNIIGNNLILSLDNNGLIIDVMNDNNTSIHKNIFLINDAGAKEEIINGKKTKEYYIKTIDFDGKTKEFLTQKSYEHNKNSLVEVNNKGMYTQYDIVKWIDNVDGTFDWDNKKFDNHILSDDIKVLEIYSPDYKDPSIWKSISPQRLNGMFITKSQLLYYQCDGNNKINRMCLKNATGDLYKYGIMIKTNIVSGKRSYKYDINGKISDFSQLSPSFPDVSNGVPFKTIQDPKETKPEKMTKTMQSLNLLIGKIENISFTNILCNDENFPISTNVCVYIQNDYGTYLIMPIEKLVQNYKDYSIRAYYDSQKKYGGCIRIIVIQKNN